MTRILVTGSREWRDRATIDEALLFWFLHFGDDRAILVHGDCHLGGADIIARNIWREHGLTDEPHPADWATHGKDAGRLRNQEMVDLGADVCLAFPLPGSRGTRDCIRRAHQAAIPVHIYEPRLA